MMWLGRLCVLVLVAVAQLGSVSGAGAAPRAELWTRWQTHDPDSTATIDHETWADFLARYVETADDGINRIAYQRVTAADRAALAAYVAQLAARPISSYGRAEQMAYWINLYNALTVRVVLEHYPVDSIRDIDISPGLFTDGPWASKLIEVEGEPLSLDDIEHRILRPIWADPRIHYAVNCASIGCPNLQPEPFRAATLDRQLDQAAAEFINHPRAASVMGGQLKVSSIYRWFESDFGGTDRDVIAHLKAYAAPPLAMQLDRFSRIDQDGYDWRLNDAGRDAAVKPS